MGSLIHKGSRRTVHGAQGRGNQVSCMLNTSSEKALVSVSSLRDITRAAGGWQQGCGGGAKWPVCSWIPTAPHHLRSQNKVNTRAHGALFTPHNFTVRT